MDTMNSTMEKDTRAAGAWVSIVVFLAALAARLFYLWEINGTPVTELLLIDSETYDRFARMILDGRFRGEEVYSMNILYPYFLAVVYAVGRGEWTSALPVQAILDSFSVLFLYRIGLRLFDKKVALLAAVIAGLYGPFVFYAGALLTPSLINFFCLGMLLLLVRYREAPAPKTAAAAGLLLGLASLGRGNSMLLLPLAILFFMGAVRPRRKALLHWAFFAVAALTLPLLMSARNYMVEKRVVPMAANYAAFYIGHNPEANGLYNMTEFVGSADFEGEVLGTRRTVSEAVGREVTLAESADHLFRKGVKYAIDHPSEETRRTLKKFYFFWNRTEAPTNLNYYFARDFSRMLRILPVTFGLLAALGITGMVLLRKEWRKHLLLYLYLSVYLLTALLFFVSAEYRLPAAPVLMLFAAHTGIRLTGHLIARLRGRRPRTKDREFIFTLLLFHLLLLFTHYRTTLLKAQTLKRVDYLNFGILYCDKGSLESSEKMLLRSLEIDPAFGPAHTAIAETYRRMGNEMRAAESLELSRRYALGGQYENSVAPPGAETTALLEVARIYQGGDYAEALRRFEELLTRYKMSGKNDVLLSIRNNIGLCHYKMKEMRMAEETFRAIIQESPGYVKAQTNLARVCESEGGNAEAESLYRKALALDPENRSARAGLERVSNGAGAGLPGTRR